MYAVFEISGFQFRGEEGETIKVPRQTGDVGSKLDFSDIMLVKGKDSANVGTPFVDGAKVQAEIVSHGKNDKVEIYKYKKRTKYRRRQGHRQDFTEIKISKIVAP